MIKRAAPFLTAASLSWAALAMPAALAGMGGSAQAATGEAITVAEMAERASGELRASISELEQATKGKDQVAALTRTIRAYEEGLAALREALRQAELREATLQLRFHSKRDRVGQLLTVLARMENNPGPMLLLHPTGPVGTARSGMLMAEVTPGLQAEIESLRVELQEIADLRELQISAGKTLSEGLETAQNARTALSKAISERKTLPKRFTEDPAVLKELLESSDTLDAFAAGLAFTSIDGVSIRSFGSTMGGLPLPVIGTLLRGPDEADAAGHRRPGMALATRPGALVTAPWPATIRYIGPLLDYGNVTILEPGDGYLMVLAGMATLYGEVGEVVAQGAPLGLMGGGDAIAASGGTGASDTETLYLEIRLGAAPVDPTLWFAATAMIGE